MQTPKAPPIFATGPTTRSLAISSNGTLDSQPFFIQFSGQQASVQPPAASAVVCTGQMPKLGGNIVLRSPINGSQKFAGSDRAQSPRCQPCVFYRNNAQGQPVYRGSFQDATELALVDLSGGNPRPGSPNIHGSRGMGLVTRVTAVKRHHNKVPPSHTRWGYFKIEPGTELF